MSCCSRLYAKSMNHKIQYTMTVFEVAFTTYRHVPITFWKYFSLHFLVAFRWHTRTSSCSLRIHSAQPSTTRPTSRESSRVLWGFDITLYIGLCLSFLCCTRIFRRCRTVPIMPLVHFQRPRCAVLVCGVENSCVPSWIKPDISDSLGFTSCDLDHWPFELNWKFALKLLLPRGTFMPIFVFFFFVDLFLSYELLWNRRTDEQTDRQDA